MRRSVFVSCFVKTARVQLRHSRIGFVRAEGERDPDPSELPNSPSIVVAGRHGPQSAPGRLDPVPRTAIAVQDDALGQVQVRRCCCSDGRASRRGSTPVCPSIRLSVYPPTPQLTRSFVRSARVRCGCECVRYEEVDTYQARERLEGIGSGPPRCVEYDETTCGRCLDERGVAWLAGWLAAQPA